MAAATLSACGGSGVSEDEAAQMLREKVHVENIGCVKAEADRTFLCNVHEGEEEEAKVSITVSESGETLVVTHCEAAQQGQGQYGGIFRNEASAEAPYGGIFRNEASAEACSGIG